LTYDIDVDDAMVAPEPPEPPDFMNEFTMQDQKRRTSEKK